MLVDLDQCGVYCREDARLEQDVGDGDFFRHFDVVLSSSLVVDEVVKMGGLGEACLEDCLKLRANSRVPILRTQTRSVRGAHEML